MTLQTTGAIDVDDLHVEAGGTTGSAATINDSDIRALADNIPSAHPNMNIGFWYGAPFSTGSWPTGPGSIAYPISTLIYGFDRNGDGVGEASFRWQIKHEPSNNRINFQQITVAGANQSSTQNFYFTYTGDVLDNVANSLADWEFKVDWSITEIDASDGTDSTTFTTPDDSGYNSGTWYNISATTHDPIYEWKVSTTDPNGNGTITNSKIQGTATFYIRCVKSGIAFPFPNGNANSGSKTLDIQANAGATQTIEP